MVGGDGADATVGEGEAQGIAVVGSLHGGVALDECPFAAIVGTGEEQVGEHGFEGDVAATEFQFTGCRHMGDVQVGAIGASELCGQCRRLVAGFLRADERVEHHVGIVAVGFLHLLHL